MSDDMLYNETLAAALNMDARAHKERIVALEQLCKDAATLLATAPDLGSYATRKDRDAWRERRFVILQRIEQEIK
ncbi:MAG TPA: hypothetical protein VFQ36_24280 [Ktedonobacteraceae bacterium]|nr:hypothetical protein [Ktedonobacteraceae bacterium]